MDDQQCVKRTRGGPQTLDLGLDIVDSIGRFHLEGDRLTRQGFDEDLHDEDLNQEESAFTAKESQRPSHHDEQMMFNIPRQECLPQPSMQMAVLQSRSKCSCGAGKVS